MTIMIRFVLRGAYILLFLGVMAMLARGIYMSTMSSVGLYDDILLEQQIAHDLTHTR